MTKKRKRLSVLADGPFYSLAERRGFLNSHLRACVANNLFDCGKGLLAGAFKRSLVARVMAPVIVPIAPDTCFSCCFGDAARTCKGA